MVLIVALIAGAFYLVAIWEWTRELEDAWGVRFSAIWAIGAIVLLIVASGYLSLCGISENRSELFNERCEGGTPSLSLYGIPLVVLAPFVRRFLPGGDEWTFVVAIAVAGIVATAVAVPMRLLSV
jgi:hypothetical protein